VLAKVLRVRCLESMPIGWKWSGHQLRLPAFATVGLPEAASRSSRERVKSGHFQFRIPLPGRPITVNWRPPHPMKEGTASICPSPWDLAATGHRSADAVSRLPSCWRASLEAGQPVRARSRWRSPRAFRASAIIVPYDNGLEASVVDGMTCCRSGRSPKRWRLLRGQITVPACGRHPGHLRKRWRVRCRLL